mmetsp:Transcript_7930/g.14115  ORF Transcript_7930/g.14115 Transcript_7930/m.14115 type:complete len:200 (-) Transcript_7930:310-909(-)
MLHITPRPVGHPLVGGLGRGLPFLVLRRLRWRRSGRLGFGVRQRLVGLQQPRGALQERQPQGVLAGVLCLLQGKRHLILRVVRQDVNVGDQLTLVAGGGHVLVEGALVPGRLHLLGRDHVIDLEGLPKPCAGLGEELLKDVARGNLQMQVHLQVVQVGADGVQRPQRGGQGLANVLAEFGLQQGQGHVPGEDAGGMHQL